MFNPRYRGAFTIKDCVDIWDADEESRLLSPPAEPPAKQPKVIDAKDLWLWQTVVSRVLSHPEDPVHGRTFLWLWEPVGKFGKSILVSYLRARRAALTLRASTNNDEKKSDSDIMHVAINYVKERGDGPPICIFDFARADLASTGAESVPWSAAEVLKDGCIASTKYGGRTYSFDRPHVLFVGNAPCPAVAKFGAQGAAQPVLVSGDRFIEINVRTLQNYLEGTDNPAKFATLQDIRNAAERCELPGTRVFDSVGTCINNDGEVA
jgi:hypothetical protein